MNSIEKNNIFFLGAGGIGMSALARHFKNMGKNVAGYDRTSTKLTQELIEEGIDIHFEDRVNLLPTSFINREETLVIYTPAIPKENTEFVFFSDNGFEMVKRAHVLGLITNNKKGIAISGTHGKTSVSTFTSFLLNRSKVGCSAFLGGISKNFNSNYIFSDSSEYIVVEADEFDRSFLQLHPYIALVTAIDADHLEIYKNKENIVSSFNQFINQVNKNGYLVINKNVEGLLNYPDGPIKYTYSVDEETCDFYATNITLNKGLYGFDLVTPKGIFKNLRLGIPGNVNLENSIAAMACAILAGLSEDEIRNYLPEIKGVKRRFDVLYSTEKTIYIDDYAHHPEEIKRFLESLKEIYPDKKITGIFQPHLFSRTMDFADDFATSLSLLDELYLLDIYPARELPIPGVTSKIIFDHVRCDEKTMKKIDDIPALLKEGDYEVLVTMGAGDIDVLTDKIVKLLKEREIEKV